MPRSSARHAFVAARRSCPDPTLRARQRTLQARRGRSPPGAVLTLAACAPAPATPRRRAGATAVPPTAAAKPIVSPAASPASSPAARRSSPVAKPAASPAASPAAGPGGQSSRESSCGGGFTEPAAAAHARGCAAAVGARHRRSRTTSHVGRHRRVCHPPTAKACRQAAARRAEGAPIYAAKCASCHGDRRPGHAQRPAARGARPVAGRRPNHDGQLRAVRAADHGLHLGLDALRPTPNAEPQRSLRADRLDPVPAQDHRRHRSHGCPEPTPGQNAQPRRVQARATRGPTSLKTLQ